MVVLFWFLFIGPKAIQSEDSEPEDRHDLAQRELEQYATLVDINMCLIYGFYGMPDDSAAKDLLVPFFCEVLVKTRSRITAKEALDRIDSHIGAFFRTSRKVVPLPASSTDPVDRISFIKAGFDFDVFVNDHLYTEKGKIAGMTFDSMKRRTSASGEPALALRYIGGSKYDTIYFPARTKNTGATKRERVPFITSKTFNKELRER